MQKAKRKNNYTKKELTQNVSSLLWWTTRGSNPGHPD